MPRSRIPGSGAFVDRARRHGLGSCRGVWFATVCTHLTPVFQGGSCEGEEADSASIRGHLVSSQFPWEVKFASVMSAPPFLGTSASAASKTATGNSAPRSRRLASHSQGARNEGRRNRSSALGKAFRSGGTESSNPASSSGESSANLTSLVWRGAAPSEGDSRRQEPDFRLPSRQGPNSAKCSRCR